MGIAGWCGAPIIAGDWRELEGDEARAMADAIRSAALDRRGDLIREDRIDRVRVLPIACYPGGLLVEAQVHIGDETGLSNHLHGPWGLVTLDGGSAVIHDLNDEGALSLDTEEAARAYHALFCNSVRGDDGRFHTVTDPNELLWYAPPDDAIFAAITIGVRIERTEAGWEIESPVAYAGTMFVARFELTPDGMIEMVDDAPIAEELPIAVETWRAQCRFPPQGNA
jgi:hypothetical protein